MELLLNRQEKWIRGLQDGQKAEKREGIAAALGADQAAVIEEPAESDDAASPQSLGKMDSQAQGGLKRLAS